jgi:hypothetical protein
MWNTESLWVEVAAVSLLYALGHIFMGHFEERTSAIKKVIKLIVSLARMIILSVQFGRTVAFIVFGLMFLPVIYIHAFWLPSKGINGWTGEPKSKYYELRGWSKDIF